MLNIEAFIFFSLPGPSGIWKLCMSDYYSFHSSMFTCINPIGIWFCHNRVHKPSFQLWFLSTKSLSGMSWSKECCWTLDAISRKELRLTLMPVKAPRGNGLEPCLVTWSMAIFPSKKWRVTFLKDGMEEPQNILETSITWDTHPNLQVPTTGKAWSQLCGLASQPWEAS